MVRLVSALQTHSPRMLHSKNTGVKLDPDRVHWGQTSRRVNDDRKMTQSMGIMKDLSYSFFIWAYDEMRIVNIWTRARFSILCWRAVIHDPFGMTNLPCKGRLTCDDITFMPPPPGGGGGALATTGYAPVVPQKRRERVFLYRHMVLSTFFCKKMHSFLLYYGTKHLKCEKHNIHIMLYYKMLRYHYQLHDNKNTQFRVMFYRSDAILVVQL